MSADKATQASPRWAIRCILAACLLIAAGYALAFGGTKGATLGAWALALGNALLAPAAMALGTPALGGRARLVRLALWATGLVLFFAFAAALVLPADESATSRLVLGFPRRAAIVIYGAGVLPLLVLPALFAWSFDGRAFSADRVRRIRELAPRTAAPDESDREPPQ